VLTNEVPDLPDQSARPASSRRPRHRKLTVIIVSLVAVLVAFCGLTARLFVFPASGMPNRVDAIVMMNGSDQYSRMTTAFKLAYEGRAPVLVVSRGSAFFGQGSYCAPPIPHVKVICFDPSPPTTQGEAEYAGRLAKQYHWHSIALVTITPQDSRARLRLERCFSGHVYVMTAPIPLWMWPFEVAYEWGATIKALTVNRSC
jgi:uncharacterized SAM-binding protein YcdF (DUF218 family)